MRAQWNGWKRPTASGYEPSIPHARAAGPPTGRSFFLRRGPCGNARPSRVRKNEPFGRDGVGPWANATSRTLAGSDCSGLTTRAKTEMKKGAGASPLFKLTPQKPNPSRGSGPATPGSQSHVLPVERAIVVPANGPSPADSQLIDFTSSYAELSGEFL